MWLLPAIFSRTTARISARSLTVGVLLLALLGALVLVWQRPHVAGLMSPTTVRPGESLAATVAAAGPGSVIVVKPGVYREQLVTAQSGTARRPIIIRAEPGAVVQGEGHGRLVTVTHNYWQIEGLELRGADTLLWLQGADHNRITRNYFHHAQGECIRAKYHADHNVFERNRIEHCGGKDFGGGGPGKNGEGIYLGTAPEQLSKNPTPEADHTNANTIRRNTFLTQGNECVDIKEGSSLNIVEFNDCTGQRDSESGGFDSRGNNNTFRYNKSYNNRGAGIRFGGDTAADGINNEAYGNVLTGNQQVALKVQRLPQGLICGNTASDNTGGLTNNKVIVNPPCASPLPAPGS